MPILGSSVTLSTCTPFSSPQFSGFFGALGPSWFSQRAGDMAPARALFLN